MIKTTIANLFKAFIVCTFLSLNLMMVSCKNNVQQLDTRQESYLGLSLDEANQLAMKNQVRFRAIEIDGKKLAVTMDYVPGRINARVKDNQVISYSIEGQ